jgi:hypothetical protein
VSWLAVSNYAFSEPSRDLQEAYFRKALNGTPRGYITHNDISPASYRALPRDELAAELGEPQSPNNR